MSPKVASVLCMLTLFLASASSKFTAQQRSEFDGFLKRVHLKFDAKDYDQRLEIFQKNLKRIDEFNKNSKMARFAANKFAAMTHEEIKKYLIPIAVFEEFAAKHNDHVQDHSKRVKRQAAPASIDYRANGWVTPVKDQGQCGSCWAFSSCACVESAYLRFGGVSLDLSEQQLVDCAPASATHTLAGCRGGVLPYAMEYIVANGVGYESAYPYTQVQGTCKAVSPVEKNVQYSNLGTNEAAIMDWLANKGPVEFGFNVPQDFMYFAGGVYETTCPQPFAGGHAMTIVGYTPEYWIIKNSWGTGWGEEGYVYWARSSPICSLMQVLGVTYTGTQPPTTTTAPANTTTAAPQTTTAPVTAAPTTTASPETTSVTPNPGSCQCAAGYTYNPATTYCYKMTFGTTFDAATKLCAADNGSLVDIHSAAENDWLVAFAQSSSPRSELGVWTAFVNQYSCGLCWYNGAPKDYEKWAPGYPQAWETKCPGYVGGQGLLITDSAAPAPYNGYVGQWMLSPDCSEVRNGICKLKPKTNDCRCGEGYFYFAGSNSCFKVVTNTGNMTWQAAAEFCAAENGTPASIHSKEENDFVVGLLETSLPTGWEPNAWIGLIEQAYCGTCWVDGTPIDYANWLTGYPVGSPHLACPNYTGSRTILVADKSPYKGQWMTTWACAETHAAVCKRKPLA